MACFSPLTQTEFVMARIEDGTRSEKTVLVMDWLTVWLKFLRLMGKTGVVVFDIDDTLLDDEENRIRPVARVYALCRSLGFQCAIVTARPEGSDNRSLTIKALREAGIRDWESLYMMPKSLRNRIVTDEDLKRLVSQYKRESRDDIALRFDILANIGDMWHDLILHPLKKRDRCLQGGKCEDCAIFFPAHGHGEVALKLVGSAL